MYGEIGCFGGTPWRECRTYCLLDWSVCPPRSGSESAPPQVLGDSRAPRLPRPPLSRCHRTGGEEGVPQQTTSEKGWGWKSRDRSNFQSK